MTDASTQPAFGEGDATLQAVGGMEGLTKLVHNFYRIMAETSDYRPLFDMHPQPIDTSIDKLVLFLHGWMGGERMYAKKYGQIALPRAHAHLKVNDKYLQSNHQRNKTNEFDLLSQKQLNLRL